MSSPSVKPFGGVFPTDTADSKSPSGKPEASAATSIAPDGDVILHVSCAGQRGEYHVSSQILCTTSSVFKGMLGKSSNFAEAVALRRMQLTGSDVPLDVHLEDDDPWAMGVVLRVLHSRHYSVPREVTLAEMVKIAVVCDKYCFHEGLHTTSGIWLASLASEESIKEFPEDWLLVSWVFGPEEIFTRVSRALIRSASESDGKLVFGYNRRTLSDIIPSAVYEEIKRCRALYFDVLLEVVLRLEEIYFRPDPDKPICCASRNAGSHDRQRCDMLQVGHLYRTFHAGAQREWLTGSGSCQQFVDAVHSLPVIDFREGTLGYNYHPSCGWLQKLQVDAIDIFDKLPGLYFSEFPSRKWGIV